MTNTPAGSSTERFTYGTDPRSSVSLLIDAAGAARAAYGYRPYGDADTVLTKGDADPTSVLGPYRYTGKRLDSISGSLDMGARRFGPDITRFLQPDRYQTTLHDVLLSLDPLTQNRYAFAGGNPVSFVETDGHAFTYGDDGGACVDPACVGNSAGGFVPRYFCPECGVDFEPGCCLIRTQRWFVTRTSYMKTDAPPLKYSRVGLPMGI